MDVLLRTTQWIRTRPEVMLGVLIAAVTTGSVLTAGPDGPDRGYWAFAVGAGLAICATAVARGRYRARAAVIGLLVFAAAGLVTALWHMPGPVFGGGLLGLLVLGAAAMRSLPPRLAAILAIAGTVLVAVSGTVDASGLLDHRTVYALTAVIAWDGALAVGVWLRYLDSRHREALVSVRRDERLELARELHDVVAHHVTGMVVQAQAARFTGQERPEQLMSALAGIEDVGVDTLAAIRRLVGLLRDPDDSPGVAPGPEPVSELVARFARHHGPAVDLRLPEAGLPPEVAGTVYRIVQEALTNIARHAPEASAVAVSVIRGAEQVSVEITDDAPRGGAPAARTDGGYGLIGMRERVEALGGTLRAGPRPGTGWAVQASLPVTARGTP